MGPWAPVGLLLISGAAATFVCARSGYRDAALVSLTLANSLFIGILFGAGSAALDAFKAPRPLTLASHARQTQDDVRVGCYQYFQPSLVFYCGREVQRLDSQEEALQFLNRPLPVYLFLPAAAWQQLKAKLPEPRDVLARHYDLYRRCDVVVVSNR
jgi:hypothetical protein